MGFEFKNRKTTVEVCGKSYMIEKGSVDVAQRVDAMQKRMANMTESELNSPDAMKKVSDALRDIVGALLGKKAQEEIFEGRNPNILDEIELLTYLLDELNSIESDGIDDVLARLDVSVKRSK